MYVRLDEMSAAILGPPWGATAASGQETSPRDIEKTNLVRAGHLIATQYTLPCILLKPIKLTYLVEQ